MVKRLLMFLGVALVLAAVALGGLALLNQEPGNGNVAMQQFINAPILNSQLPRVNGNINANPAPAVQPRRLTQEEYEQQVLGQLAKDFAARLATYSNQNFGNNINELLPQTTGNARTYLETLRNQYQAIRDEYIGTTSQAVTLAWHDFVLGGSAQSVTVGLHRVETRGSEEKTYNQDVTLGLVKTGDEWMVEKIEWGERY